jgi:hypothetical protein
MNPKLIFLPVLVQVLLTLSMYIHLTRVKARAQRDGKVDEARRALYDDAWPDSVIQVNNNIRNQFETPVLFYVLTLVFWSLNAAGLVAQILAWLYVASRLVHAYVHVGSNYVPLRRRVFTLGVLLLVAMTGLATVALF